MVGWGLVSATQNRARRTESYVSLMSEMSRKRAVSREPWRSPFFLCKKVSG